MKAMISRIKVDAMPRLEPMYNDDVNHSPPMSKMQMTNYQ